jgi:hypothetical protein
MKITFWEMRDHIGQRWELLISQLINSNMKLLNFKFFLLFGIIALFFIGSCTKNQNEQFLKVVDFDNVGKLHNDFLTAANFAFLEGLVPTDPNYLNLLNDFNKQYILQSSVQQKFGITLAQADSFTNALESNKLLLLKSNLLYALQSDPNRLQIKLPEMVQNNKFSSFGSDLLLNFLNDIQSNLDGTLSNEQLRSKVDQYIVTFDNHNYIKDSGEGQVIGTILAISDNSLDWWFNPNNLLSGIVEPRIAPWLAADLLGAACGAGSSLLDNYLNGEDLNWRSAAAWALGGAVCGSVGIRIGRK